MDWTFIPLNEKLPEHPRRGFFYNLIIGSNVTLKGTNGAKLLLRGQEFDLVLAGHSHGGQVWLPLYGPVYVPFGVDEYARGLFHTEAGPLYVNPGIGWFPVPIRFNCRPEITVFDL